MSDSYVCGRIEGINLPEIIRLFEKETRITVPLVIKDMFPAVNLQKLAIALVPKAMKDADGCNLRQRFYFEGDMSYGDGEYIFLCSPIFLG